MGRTTLVVDESLNQLHRRMTTLGLCVSEGPNDARWMPDVAPPRSQHRRAELRQQAESACAGCSVINACREWAVATGQQYGIWGGIPEHELAEIRVARRRSLRQIARQEAA